MSVLQDFAREAAEKGEFMSYSRFAIYFVPADDTLADFGAAWLGWDIRTGREAAQLNVNGLHDITMTPMKYGFHGTLKPPFRLNDDTTEQHLSEAAEQLASRLAPAVCEGLSLATLGHFFALTPYGDVSQVQRVARACVVDLDPFRAPMTKAELARRRQANLSEQQDVLLRKWGYPYVLEEFRFHLTLSGRVPSEEMDHWSRTVQRHLPALPQPFRLDQIALCGEREDGRFERIHSYHLTG